MCDVCKNIKQYIPQHTISVQLRVVKLSRIKETLPAVITSESVAAAAVSPGTGGSVAPGFSNHCAT